ncbi:hypothetical protein [Listeria costaricensis]|uniref:hypothetical protein n=1 Tax=Listeria costaricensis TaxID=2026604 RepID=UPI000C06D50F|nr:hypothetical protein [Listeria costaricensis]
MTNKYAKQYRRLLEQEHTLPYKLLLNGQEFASTLYTKLGKITGIVVWNQADDPATKEEAQQIVSMLQKYTFYFDYLGKRDKVLRERDSLVAEKIEQTQLILNNNQIYGEKMQPVVDELSLTLEVYKQQQRKLDIYQEDIALLNEKIKEQGKILEEDWESAEDLSVAFMIASYAQSIYLEATREHRRKLVKWYHENQRELNSEDRKALSKLVNLLSDTNAGLVFDQIISLIPLLENGLLLDHDESLTKRAQEFNKEYEAHCHFYKPNAEKFNALIRN